MKIIKGKTVKGKELGRSLGYPTLNIPYSGHDSGVFAGKVLLDGQWISAAVNLGRRPTIDEASLCEAFLLDWHGSVKVGTEIEVKLMRKIREVKKFPNFEELKEQIAMDVKQINKRFHSFSG